MDRSDVPVPPSSQHARDPIWPLNASNASTWNFDAAASASSSSHNPPNPEGSSRLSLFASPTSPSRFTSATTPPLPIPERPRQTTGDYLARTPPNISANLASLDSSPEDWRPAQLEDDRVRATANRRRLPRVEKDVDDPTQAESSRPGRATHSRNQSSTLTTLSRLFAVKAATSPTDSRDYMHDPRSSPKPRRSVTGENVPLPEHLYTRGLLGGRHSDITVHAFGYPYKLHRILLDRAPFFASALSGPWLESNAREMTIDPSDIDGNITQTAFELALKRLYGAGNPDEEDAEAPALFATGCWLEMPDLVDSSIESMLRQMSAETLSPLIRLVTGNYYGRSGDKILASAKAMLCRDGWKMPLSLWDGIPGDIVREIVGGDGFFIDGEWSRWVLAKRILDRRLKSLALAAGLVDPKSRNRVAKAPDATNLMAVRFDNVYRRNAMTTAGGIPDVLHPWITLYTSPEIEPILVLLDEGIHYVHLPFEQLQYIRSARDALGLPILPERIISNALWMQMELRQKVLNAHDSQMELGLSQPAEDWQDPTTVTWETGIASTDAMSPSQGKNKAGEPSWANNTTNEDIPSDSWDQNGKARKFWIPSSDCNIVMGGNADPVIATSSSGALQNHTSRLSATIHPEDVQWASDFAANTIDKRLSGTTLRPGSTVGGDASEMRPIAYTHFPPFRFAAEFPNPRVLKERKRVYSQTVFYMGSFWNVYVQKVRRGKNPQLGVYLHRAKEREAAEVIAGGATGLRQSSVDERIGQLEREMLMRTGRGVDGRRGTIARHGAYEGEMEADGGDSSGSADPETMIADSSASRASTLGRKTSQTAAERSSTGATAAGSGTRDFADDATLYADDDEDDETEDPELLRLTRAHHVPTLPPYMDGRPTIRTYFKIYSPSKGGRMLSVYESAPDTFNFSQSWGWKSSTLMLDDGIMSDDGNDDMDLPLAGGGSGSSDGGGSVGGGLGQTGAGAEGGGLAGAGMRKGSVVKKDGKLRFMIVIGNV